MKRISPGCYVDEKGLLHIFVGEMLRENGFADTPHNRGVMTETAAKLFREKYPECSLTIDDE